MHSRKTLLTLILILTIAAIVVPGALLIAAKPQPLVPVTATYRDDLADALQSDDGTSYGGSLAADGSRLTVSSTHPYCYWETTVFDDGGECLEGNLPDGFSICGGGEIVVTPHLESFFDMSDGESQPADATARIIGNDNFRYFVRFKPTDTLVSDENCSTPVTIIPSRENRPDVHRVPNLYGRRDNPLSQQQPLPRDHRLEVLDRLGRGVGGPAD